MEDPGYGLARQVFLAAGAEVIPSPWTGRACGRGAARGAPGLRHAVDQFPLGGVMSAGRRRDLLAWAQRTGAYVVEDDYDGEYRFDIAPIPTLQAMDGAGRTIYLGTVSKTLSPTLRLGYLVAPAALSLSSPRPRGWRTGIRRAWSRRPWPT